MKWSLNMAFPASHADLEIEAIATRKFIKNHKNTLSEEDYTNRVIATNAGLHLKKLVFDEKGFEYFDKFNTIAKKERELTRLIDIKGAEMCAKRFRKSPNRWAQANRK